MTVELMDVLGKKPDGSTDFIGKGPMVPMLKIPELLREYGLSTGDFGCEDDLADSVRDAFIELVRWMEKQGWTPPPLLVGMPSHLDLLKTAIHRLEDILKDDDGQAYKEAQRFVEQARKVVPA